MAAAAGVAPDALPSSSDPQVSPRASPETDLAPADAPPDPPVPAPAPPAFDWRALVDPDLWDLVPPDVPELLALLPHADLYVQDEVNIDLHPTLTRCWARQGRHGQRLVRAPGQNAKVVGFAAADWRDGWLSHGIGRHRDSASICLQLEQLIARSQKRGRIVFVVWDNLGVHTRRGSKRLRAWLDEHADQIRLIYTPAYDPEANPTERFWRPFRHRVTHNHHRDQLYDLYLDADRYFVGLDALPQTVLRHLGSPLTPSELEAA